MKTLLKKYKLIDDNKIYYLFPDEIINIIPAKDKNENIIMIVNYYDDEFCCNLSKICNKIEVEDY